MFRIKLAFLILACGLLFPSLSLAQEMDASATAPSAAIASPSNEVYTRADRIYPSVAFASTSQIVDVDYMLNGQYVAYDKTLPLFSQPLGTSTFSVVTKNVLGEVSTTSVTFLITATRKSTADDIRQAYTEGLITKVVIRDRFLRSLELYADTYEKREKLLSGTEKRKEERAALLTDRMNKLLDNDILDLLKKQDGRTVKKEGVALIREDIEALKVEAGL